MRRSLPLALLLLALVAVPAFAATRNGVTPKAPAQGDQVQRGDDVTFSGRVSGGGSVWVRVCRSKARSGNGLICATGLQARARRDGSRWRLGAPQYRFPGYWLNAPGRWYWQAHRVSCDRSGRNCLKGGPVQSLRVR